MPTVNLSVGTTVAFVNAPNPKHLYEYMDVLIQNLSANNIYIGSDDQVTTASGLKLVATTGVYTNDHRADPIYLIADGATSDVRVTYAIFQDKAKQKGDPVPNNK